MLRFNITNIDVFLCKILNGMATWWVCTFYTKFDVNGENGFCGEKRALYRRTTTDAGVMIVALVTQCQRELHVNNHYLVVMDYSKLLLP